MTSGQAKQKGNNYERQICHKLSLWVSDFKREDVFWRSAMSGGRAKLASRKNRTLETQAGDISAIHPSGAPLLDLFVLECKHYAKIGLSKCCYGKKGELYHEWAKLLEDCQIGQRVRAPLMFVRENRQDDLVLTNDDGLRILGSGANQPLDVLFSFPPRSMWGLRLRDVFTDVSPDRMFAANPPAPIVRPRRKLIIEPDGEKQD